MRAEKVAYTLLAASATLTALVSTRIYPSELPQGVALPAVVYRTISGVEPGQIDAAATARVVQTRIQVTALASSYAACKDVVEACRAALLYQYGTVASVPVISIIRDLIGPDDFDAELEVFAQSIDVIITHLEQ